MEGGERTDMTTPYAGILIEQGETKRKTHHVPPNKRCTLAAMLMAGRIFESCTLDLDELEDLALKSSAFHKGGMMLLPHVLAPAMGLKAPAASRLSMDENPGITMAQMQGRIASCINGGGCALLCVDHDLARAGGDADGDHYVLGVGWERPWQAQNAQRLIYLDPAVGRAGALSFVSLEGEALWGTPRRAYKVRSVRLVSLTA
jgi:hypothetical protein